MSRAVLTMADWEAPRTLDPAQATTVARLRADTLVYARLWVPAPDGRLVPDLAGAVPRAVGGMLTVTLRPHLRWSDGSPLTAADVARSCSAECGGIAASALGRDRVRFATADPGRLDTLFVAPERPTGAVASGPFRLAAADAGELRFERNPFYRGRAAYLAEIDLVIAASHDAMVEAAQTGEFDYLPHLGPADLPVPFGDLHSVVTISNRVEILVPRELDPRTVAALALGIQRAALSAQAFGGRAEPAGPTSLSAARSLLAGRHPQLTLVTLCDDPVRDQEATALVAQLAALGVVARPTCGPLGQVLAPPGGAALSLYSVQADAVPAGAIPLLRWPALRAVSPDVHGFVPNDTSGTDLWNVADWWLS